MCSTLELQEKNFTPSQHTLFSFCGKCYSILLAYSVDRSIVDCQAPMIVDILPNLHFHYRSLYFCSQRFSIYIFFAEYHTKSLLNRPSASYASFIAYMSFLGGREKEVKKKGLKDYFKRSVFQTFFSCALLLGLERDNIVHQ